MSDAVWAEVYRRMSDHAYMGALQRTSERVDQTAEVFTPTELVITMLQRIPLPDLGPGRTILDPACGDGQFLVGAKWVKILAHGMDETEALSELFGVDIMRDNVDLCLERLGGGTIVMGDALNPERELEGQTVSERELLRTMFGLRPAPQPLFG